MVDLVVLACVLGATTKKVVNFFAFPQIFFSRTSTYICILLRVGRIGYSTVIIAFTSVKIISKRYW